MKITITKEWAKAIGIPPESRTFDVLRTEHNFVGRAGFDTFYTIKCLYGNRQMKVAHARIEGNEEE